MLPAFPGSRDPNRDPGNPISGRAFSRLSGQSETPIEREELAVTHVSAAFTRGRRIRFIRISTDTEINVNEKPEGLSVAGKDIR